jgi:hypothetical protein
VKSHKVRNAYGQWIDAKGVPHPKRKITDHTPAGYDSYLVGETQRPASRRASHPADVAAGGMR